MKIAIPEAHCFKYKAPIYSNLSNSCNVECNRCTGKNLTLIKELKRNVGDDLLQKEENNWIKKSH